MAAFFFKFEVFGLLDLRPTNNDFELCITKKRVETRLIILTGQVHYRGAGFRNKKLTIQNEIDQF